MGDEIATVMPWSNQNPPSKMCMGFEIHSLDVNVRVLSSQAGGQNWPPPVANSVILRTNYVAPSRGTVLTLVT